MIVMIAMIHRIVTSHLARDFPPLSDELSGQVREPPHDKGLCGWSLGVEGGRQSTASKKLKRRAAGKCILPTTQGSLK